MWFLSAQSSYGESVVAGYVQEATDRSAGNSVRNSGTLGGVLMALAAKRKAEYWMGVHWEPPLSTQEKQEVLDAIYGEGKAEPVIPAQDSPESS